MSLKMKLVNNEPLKMSVGQGAGDMLASVYADSPGVVKDSAKLGAQLPAYYAKASDIPDALSDLSDDATHRLVTDTEKTTWNAKQDALSDDVSGHYHSADRSRANHTGTQTASTISDWAASVRAVVLTGLSTATNEVISAADSVLVALGKLQAQITANLSTLTAHTGNTSNPHSTTAAQVGADASGTAAALVAERYTMAQADAIYVSLLDGTAKQYRRVMRAWFVANGCNALADLSGLMQRWYDITRTGWTGGVQFANPDVSDLSTGTRLGDNAGLSCAPSTDTVAGADGYAGIPLFIPTDVNWSYDANGELIVTAIDGISSGFSRNTLGTHVGVAQMAGYVSWVADENGVKIMYSDRHLDGHVPLPEAVKLDGTLRPYVVHSKYLMGDDLGCYSGVAPRDRDVSHNSCITLLHNKWGAHYGAGTSADDAWMKLMWWIKYATWTMDGTLDGCCSYSYQYTAAVAETGVERVLLTTAQGANLVVGSTVIVGVASTSGTDRYYLEMRSIVNRKRIKSIAPVVVDDVTYSAINIDNGGVTFDVTTDTYISTMPWYTGACDSVLGNDGSPGSLTGGKYPCKLQGIEFRTGQYEVYGDTILEGYQDGAELRMRGAVCRRASLYATSITANYKRASYYVLRPDTSGWLYLKELGFDPALPELIVAKTTGGSSSTYMRDAWYLENTAGTFLREWLAFATLTYWVTTAGLSAAFANGALGTGSWNLGARLSATGNRGDLAA